MQSCQICGNDVKDGVLCLECGSVEAVREKDMKAETKSSNIAVIIAGCFIFAVVVTLLAALGATGSVIPLSSSADIEKLFAETRNSSLKEVKRLTEQVNYDITAIRNLPPIDAKEAYVRWMVENTKEKEAYISARWDLASSFIATKELEGEALIRGFLLTPREHFVRAQNLSRAYEDTWLPIGYGATITDPDVVSMMTTSLKVEPRHKVLEIGSGSGYQSAILSHLSNFVYTIEIIEPLQMETDNLYNSLSEVYPTYKNIKRKLADGFYGWEEYAPFDRIIVTCAIDHLPPPLIKQLADNGIIVVPIGPPGRQQIMQITKTVDENGNISLKRRDVYNGVGVKFIPFRDESGKSYSTSDG